VVVVDSLSTLTAAATAVVSVVVVGSRCHECRDLTAAVVVVVVVGIVVVHIDSCSRSQCLCCRHWQLLSWVSTVVVVIEYGWRWLAVVVGATEWRLFRIVVLDTGAVLGI